MSKEKMIDPNEAPAYLTEMGAVGADALQDVRPALPVIKVVQSTSQEFKDSLAKRGIYWHELEQKEVPVGTRFSVLDFKKSRAMFDKNTLSLLCMSPDARTAVKPCGTTFSGAPTNNCAQCKNKDFDDNQENPAPKCTENWDFLIILHETNALALLRFNKTALKEGRELAQTLQQFTSRPDKPVPIFAAAFELDTPEHKSSGKNDWHVPVIKKAGWASNNLAAKALEIRETAMGRLAEAPQPAGFIDAAQTEDESMPAIG